MTVRKISRQHSIARVLKLQYEYCNVSRSASKYQVIDPKRHATQSEMVNEIE
jgi:hypothetical protein